MLAAVPSQSLCSDLQLFIKLAANADVKRGLPDKLTVRVRTSRVA